MQVLFRIKDSADVESMLQSIMSVLVIAFDPLNTHKAASGKKRHLSMKQHWPHANTLCIDGAGA